MYKRQAITFTMVACAQNTDADYQSMASDKNIDNMENLETATLGAGCFWCVEAVFQQLKGVENVE